MNSKVKNLKDLNIFLICFLFIIPLLVIILNGYFVDYFLSFLIGSVICLFFKFPFKLFISGYFWSSAISILIANWHISISTEPYIVNLLGHGADDRMYENMASGNYNLNSVISYSRLLRLFTFKDLFNQIPSFYSLLSVNCLFHALGASAIFSVTRKLNLGSFSEKFSFYSYLFFPILLIDGLTLMRDGVIASLVIILTSQLISKSFLLSLKNLITIFSLSYLRLGSGLLFLFASFTSWFLTLKKIRLTYRGLIITILFLILGFVFFKDIWEYLKWKEIFNNFIVRAPMVDFIINNSPESNFMKILKMPPGLQQIGLFLYFLFAPLSSPLNLFRNDTYLFFSALFSIWNIFSIKLCIQDFFYQINNYKLLKNKNYFRILVFFLISTYVIANYSIQLRHKSFLIPFQIILTAHSLKRNKVFDYSLSWIGSLFYSLMIIL